VADARAALFDVDGTLVDSNEFHVRAWVEAFADHGHAVAPERVAGLIGMGGDKLVPEVLPDVGEDEAQTLSDAHDAIFKDRYLAQVRPFPRAHDLMGRVHSAGWQVVLASSASEAEVDHYIDLLDIRDWVVTRTSSSEVEESKPSPDIFAAALKKAGVAADASLAIGDAPYDAEGAKRSGVATIGLLSGGYEAQVLRDAGVVALFDDAADLLARFDESPLAR